MRIALAALVSLASCRPAYKETTTASRMGERWTVHFQSNGSSDSEHVARAIDAKATEVCGGDYTIEQTTGGPQSNTYTNAGNGRTYTSHSTDTSSVIRCTE